MVSIFKKREQSTKEPHAANGSDGSNAMSLEEQRLAVFERIAGDSNGAVQTFQIIVNYVQTAVNLSAALESKKRIKGIAVKTKETLEQKLGAPGAKADENTIKNMLLQLDLAIPKLS